MSLRLAVPLALLVLANLLAPGCKEPAEGCLAEGTRIATPSGPRPIEELRPGDLVLTFDPTSQRVRTQPIIATRSLWNTVGTLATEDGRTLRLTATHPVYDEASGHFLPMAALRAGGRLLRLDAAWTAPEGLRRSDLGVARTGLATYERSMQRARVWDLTVAGDHDFFAEGILVHNKSQPRDYCPATVGPGRICEGSVRIVDTASVRSVQSEANPNGTAEGGAGGQEGYGQGGEALGGQPGELADEIAVNLGLCPPGAEGSLESWRYRTLPGQTALVYEAEEACDRSGTPRELTADEDGWLDITPGYGSTVVLPTEKFGCLELASYENFSTPCSDL